MKKSHGILFFNPINFYMIPAYQSCCVQYVSPFHFSSKCFPDGFLIFWGVFKRNFLPFAMIIIILCMKLASFNFHLQVTQETQRIRCRLFYSTDIDNFYFNTKYKVKLFLCFFYRSELLVSNSLMLKILWSRWFYRVFLIHK